DNESYDPAPPLEGESKPWYEFLEEVNGETYTRNASYAKQVFSGSAIPKLMGAFKTDLSYKDWSLSGLFTYALGGKGLDYSYMSLRSLGPPPAELHANSANS